MTPTVMTPTAFTRAPRPPQHGAVTLPKAPAPSSVKDGQEESPC